MGQIDMDKCRTKEPKLFPGSDAPDMKFIFPKEKYIIEGLITYEYIKQYDDNYNGVHGFDFSVKIQIPFGLPETCSIENIKILLSLSKKRIHAFTGLYSVLSVVKTHFVDAFSDALCFFRWGVYFGLSRDWVPQTRREKQP
jgi:hypothetical protein